ncbi:hypothetical protein [Rhizobium leguminosarum]|uniref:hypothetical protein n=1 Tax=Rhizobium leguminosarum TaxID=384 RepID=UPI00048688DE|nr:hypothetical protein [Rhizobium leguminosarum]
MSGLELIPLIVSSLGTTVFAANALYLGTAALLYGGLALGASALSKALAPKPTVPKPEDGTYNLKQSVPSLPIVLGRVKKASDYVFLEEVNGNAYHILVPAGHRINRFVQHFLHDEAVTLSGSVVVSPAHFFPKNKSYVSIESRLGAPAETAYGDVVAAFPTIWTSNHRGDGLASVKMICKTAKADDVMKVYPNQMPEHSSVLEGSPDIYDPRIDAYTYTTNLALFRLWHLTSPYGGKLSISDMYLPDWERAADVCDRLIVNRFGGVERLYHGGFWFRANNDPADVGRTIDEAGELVVYERADGTVGVHGGAYYEPSIILTRNEITAFSLDANVDPAVTVLAVRGRFTDPEDLYNTNDAAIYGDPYIGEDTQRTVTVDNVSVQSHNHMQRMQKLKYIRRNGVRVSLTAHYDIDADPSYERFIRVQYGPKLADAIIEITAKPVISLKDMTITLSGIVVPEDLYVFNSAVEEGIPGSSVVPMPRGEVPVPENFGVLIQTEVVSGGSSAAYALATWSHVSDALTYELEWERVTTSTGPQTAVSTSGADQVRSAYLADGVQYRFRLRAWSSGASSEWTDYLTRTATADPNPPSPVSGANVTVPGAGQASFGWTPPNSLNYAGVRIYSNTTNSFAGSTLLATEYGPPNIPDGRVITGLSAGTKYGFIEAFNTSNIPAAPIATGAFTVT